MLFVELGRTGPVCRIQTAEKIENRTAENLIEGSNKYKTERPKMTLRPKRKTSAISIIYPVYWCVK